MASIGKRLLRGVTAALDGIPGELGKLNTDGSYTVKVDGTLNEVYVRKYGDPLQTVTAIDLRTSRKARLPVRIRKNLSRRYIVLGADEMLAGEFLGEGAASANIPPIIADSVNAIWNSDQLKPGRVRPETGSDLQFRMEELPYPEILLGGAETITDAATAVGTIASGKKAWIAFSVDPTTNALSLTNGADVDLGDELLRADAFAIAVPSGEIPLFAYAFQEGDTVPNNRPIDTVDEAYFVDLRPWITLPGSVSGSALSVTDGTTTVDPTTELDFDPAYFDVTSPGGGVAGVALVQPITLTSPVINTGVSGTAIDNDPTFASPSSTKVPTTNAVKGYVDQTVLGLSAKADVRLATAAALPTNTYSNGVSGVGATLTGVATGVLTVDGVTVALNDRILVKNEVTGANNGIYKCTVAGAIGVAYILTRTTDGDTDAELRGCWMFSTEGTANNGQGWLNTNTSAITFGSTSITWGEFSAGAIAAGTGLTKTGNTIALDTPVALANGGTHADLSATGGTAQFLKQSSAGANVTVGTIASADITTALTTPPPIGGTTPNTGVFSSLAEKIGGFLGAFTHANTADRTYTYQDVSFTVGQDTFIVAKNVTGSTISAGKFVYLSGASGSSDMQIAGLAIANSTQDHLAQGQVRTASIANNASGLVQIGGVFTSYGGAAGYGINYLSDSSAGDLVSTPPTAPSYTQIVGIHTNSLGSGNFMLLFQAPYSPSPIITDIQAFGDGSDGNVTVSAPLALTRDMYYNNLTISSGAVITPAGYRIFVLGTLDISAAPAGWIVASGGNASGQTGGTAPAAASIGGGGGGGTGGASGAVGTVGGTGDEGGTGGNGGRSGNQASTPGTVTATGQIIRRWAVDLLFGIRLLVGGSGGSGGSGGNSIVGGGGGAGGGIIYIAARTIARGTNTTASGIVSSGGTGATAGNIGNNNGAGGGGGGGGGRVYIIYKTLTGSSITNHITASGATGGSGGNALTTGGSGGAGGSGGRVTKINLTTGALTETAGSAGTAGSANTGATGGAGGAGNTFQASL